MSTQTVELIPFMRRLTAIANVDRNGQLRLPPERELAVTFEMQRSNMREHLATLEHLGFIQRTQGRGTFLQMPQPDFLQLYFDLALQLNYVSVESLENAREMLEREIVQSAATQASADDISRLRTLRDRIKKPKDVEDGISADYEFHRHLAWMTGNPIIIMLVQGLATVLRQVMFHRRVLVRRDTEAARQTNATHDAIILALEAHDPEAARGAMLRHFQVWNEQSLAVQAQLDRRSHSSEVDRLHD